MSQGDAKKQPAPPQTGWVNAAAEKNPDVGAGATNLPLYFRLSYNGENITTAQAQCLQGRR